MCIVEATRFKMQKEDNIVPSVCVENREAANVSTNRSNAILQESLGGSLMNIQNKFQEVMNRMQGLENNVHSQNDMIKEEMRNMNNNIQEIRKEISNDKDNKVLEANKVINENIEKTVMVECSSANKLITLESELGNKADSIARSHGEGGSSSLPPNDKTQSVTAKKQHEDDSF